LGTIKELTHDGAMTKAAKSFSKIVAVAIVLIVAGFGDVMYIQAMSSKFPTGGPLLAMCYVGAFTSFMAVGYLLLGKSIAFRPGGQMLMAWIVFVSELLIIGLNILLVFDPSPTGVMMAWAFVSPATPVLHMLGVALIYFADPDLHDKHHAMEIKSDMDKAERNLEYTTFQARINLRERQMQHVTKALEEAVNSPESLQYIKQYGFNMNRALLTELTGLTPIVAGVPAVPGLPPGQPDAMVNKTVEADEGSGAREPVAAAQTVVEKSYTTETLVDALIRSGELKAHEIVGHTPEALLQFAKNHKIIPGDAVLMGRDHRKDDGSKNVRKPRKKGSQDIKGGSTTT
jgi:hypothetical protein